MAAFSSVQSGDFNDTNTWDIASFPGALDTFTINANHVVTVPNAVSSTSVGTIAGTGTGARAQLVIADGGTFTLAGNLTLNSYNRITVNAGGTLDLDGNDLDFTQNDVNDNYIEFVGAADNPCKVISSTVGVGDIFCSAISAGVTGEIQVNHCVFEDCGNIQIGRNFNPGGNFRVENTVFLRCLDFYLGDFHDSTGDYYLNRIDIRDSRSTQSYVGIIGRQRGSDGSESGGGEIFVGNITVDKGTGSAASLRCELDYVDLSTNVILKNVSLATLLSTDTEQNDVLLFWDDSNIASVDSGGSAIKNGWYVYTDCDNPHLFFDSTLSYTNNVLENSYASISVTDRGDAYDLNTTINQTATYNLVIEREGGVFANALGATAKSATYSVDHNTLYMNGTDANYGHLFRTETGGNVSGTLNLRSNLVVNYNADDTNRAINIDSVQDDVITEMDYNNYYGYDANIYYQVTSATKTAGVTVGYGGNDTQLDPGFLDASRSFATFGPQVGVAQTAAAVIGYYMQINGYTSGSGEQVSANANNANVSTLVDWVRDGFQVTNALLENAGHDGVTVGAMGYYDASAVDSTVEVNWLPNLDTPIYDASNTDGQRVATTVPALGGVSFDGLTNGQSITSLVTSWGTYGNGYGMQGDTAIAYSGATSSSEMSIQSGTTGRPGDGTPAGNGDFGFIYSLSGQGHQVTEGEELWIYGKIWVPAGFNFNTGGNGLKFIRFGYPTLGPELDLYLADGQEFSTGDNTENAGWHMVNESYPQVIGDMHKETQPVFTKNAWNSFCKYTKATVNQDESIERLWINDTFAMEHVGAASDVTTRWIDELGALQSATWTPSAGSGFNWSTLEPTQAQISDFYLCTYWNNNSPQDQQLNVQCIYYVKSSQGLSSDAYGRYVAESQMEN